MAVVVVQGIGDGISPEERNALEILTNLPLDHFNKLKEVMELDIPGVVGPMTLTRFVDLCRDLDFDVSDAGVNAFKAKHGLGNSGTLHGVIGPQTAGFYFEEIMEGLEVSGDGEAPERINPEGLDLIKEFEGLARRIPGKPGHLMAYLDPVGIPTIGYGHIRGVAMGQEITFRKADELLREDLRGAEAAVSKLVRVRLTSNQFSALVSFTFNLGSGTLSRSTLLRVLNAGSAADAANQFSRFVFAGGRQLPGLVRRWKAERDLFVKA